MQDRVGRIGMVPWLCVVFAGVVGLASGAQARKAKPSPCPGGRFLVQDAPIAVGSAIAVRAIAIGDGALQLVGACSAPVKVKVVKAHSKFRSEWCARGSRARSG